MKIYSDDFDMSLIYIGVNRYWEYNGAQNKYAEYKIYKQFKHNNILKNINSINRSVYNALNNEDEPLYYYDKYNVVTPRKFIQTLKRFDLLVSKAILYTCMRKKLCTDYYLPIYNLRK